MLILSLLSLGQLLLKTHHSKLFLPSVEMLIENIQMDFWAY